MLEIGSNGGWNGDYETLIAQYDLMIARSGCTDFIIVGDTDDPGTSSGDYYQRPFVEGEGEMETGWEAALRQKYGDHFINMRLYLIKQGLSVAGLSETAEDRYDASCGCISMQLRDDWTHLNSYGYYAQAMGIYQKGVELGYWGSKETAQDQPAEGRGEGSSEKSFKID